MLKIKLFCAGGMSTSMLVKKMEEAAAVKGMEVQIAAYPEAEMEKETNDCDIALLGPQVGYRLKAAEQICKPKNIPVAVIPMVDYGMMNGNNVSQDLSIAALTKGIGVKGNHTCVEQIKVKAID